MIYIQQLCVFAVMLDEEGPVQLTPYETFAVERLPEAAKRSWKRPSSVQ